jgi:hypothetical protein
LAIVHSVFHIGAVLWMAPLGLLSFPCIFSTPVVVLCGGGLMVVVVVCEDGGGGACTVWPRDNIQLQQAA